MTSEERKNLQIFVQETLDAGVTEYPPIYIQYPYQNADQYYALNALASEYYEQKRPDEQCVIPSRRLW
uniref:Uncharacterized protein n=1 Tax=Panagrolaimus davidi TaxID=227884 RepID=A0A914QFU6_9BILA